MPTVLEIKGGQSALQYPDVSPRIIPRPEHQVSRKNIDREALKVLYRLRDAGYTAYLVGGGVRDLYLGKTPKDFDISTDAKPGQIRKLFKNSRLIGRRFRLVQVFFHGNKIVEVSTFRRRSEFDLQNNTEAATGKEQVLSANNTYGTPADDAFRRDLTINGLFYEISTFTILDYTGGIEDLDRGIIRIIGDPDRRITRDPVRMMRAIRHAARINFSIEPKTWQAIKAHRQELKLCPVSRVRDEVLKDLRGGSSKPWAHLAMESGVFEVLFPFYKQILSDPSARRDSRSEILAILSIIDRLHKENPTYFLPEHLLWALFLLPWAFAKFDIMNFSMKRAETYSFSRKIRTQLDDILGHLTIKRSVKEAITILLANIHLLHRHGKQLPKWLKKKSYFLDCQRLYAIYTETQGGAPIEAASIAVLEKKPSLKTSQRGGKGKGRSRHRGRPAFAGQTRDGVFGFKRKKRRGDK